MSISPVKTQVEHLIPHPPKKNLSSKIYHYFRSCFFPKEETQVIHLADITAQQFKRITNPKKSLPFIPEEG